MAEEKVESVDDWQQQRRRPVGVFFQPITGLGPAGEHVLWVAPASRTSRHVFKDGQPVWETVDSILADPAIEAVRDQVLKNIVCGGPARFLVGSLLLTYAAAVIRKNYVLSDDDLQMLLSGTAWQDGMTRHLLAGEDITRKLAKMVAVDDDRARRAEPKPDRTSRTPVASPKRLALRERIRTIRWRR